MEKVYAYLVYNSKSNSLEQHFFLGKEIRHRFHCTEKECGENFLNLIRCRVMEIISSIQDDSGENPENVYCDFTDGDPYMTGDVHGSIQYSDYHIEVEGSWKNYSEFFETISKSQVHELHRDDLEKMCG